MTGMKALILMTSLAMVNGDYYFPPSWTPILTGDDFNQYFPESPQGERRTYERMIPDDSQLTNPLDISEKLLEEQDDMLRVIAQVEDSDTQPERIDMTEDEFNAYIRENRQNELWGKTVYIEKMNPDDAQRIIQFNYPKFSQKVEKVWNPTSIQLEPTNTIGISQNHLRDDMLRQFIAQIEEYQNLMGGKPLIKNPVGPMPTDRMKPVVYYPPSKPYY